MQVIKFDEIIQAHNALSSLRFNHYCVISDAINVYCDLYQYIVSGWTTKGPY
jgi:hypothetical protein